MACNRDQGTSVPITAAVWSRRLSAGRSRSMRAALGTVYTLCGRITEAVPLLTQAVEQTMAPEWTGLQALCCLALGEAQLWAGRMEEAHARTAQAQALTRERQERANEAYALRLFGEIAAHRTPPESEQAVAHYQQALTLTEE